MQKGNLRAREHAEASLREMLAHLNVIDAGILQISESHGPEVTAAARDLLNRLDLVAFLAARVQVTEIPRLTDILEELVLAAQLQALPSHADVGDALRQGVDVLMLFTHDAMRRMEGHPAADLRAAAEALTARIDRIISSPDAIIDPAYKAAGL